MLDQQEPVQDLQIDEVEAEVQDAKSSGIPLWVWIVGGVVVIAAIVLIICGANGCFSGDSGTEKLKKQDVDEVKRHNQDKPVEEITAATAGPDVTVDPTPVKDTVSNEATTSSAWTKGLTPTTTLGGIVAIASVWAASCLFGGKNDELLDSHGEQNSDSELQSDLNPDSATTDKEGTDETTAAASTSYNVMSTLTEHSYASAGLGLAALLGFAAYKTGYCCNRATDKKKSGATPEDKSRKGRKKSRKGRKHGDGHSRKGSNGHRRKRSKSESDSTDTDHQNSHSSHSSTRDRKRRRRRSPTVGAQDSSHLQSGPPNNWGPSPAELNNQHITVNTYGGSPEYMYPPIPRGTILCRRGSEGAYVFSRIDEHDAEVQLTAPDLMTRHGLGSGLRIGSKKLINI